MYRKKTYSNKMYRKKIYSKKMYKKKMYRKKVHGKNSSVISNINKSEKMYKCLKHPSFQNRSAKEWKELSDSTWTAAVYHQL